MQRTIKLLGLATGLRFEEAEGNAADLSILPASADQRDACGVAWWVEEERGTVRSGQVRIFPDRRGCEADRLDFGTHLLAHEILHATLGVSHSDRTLSLMSFHPSSFYPSLSPMDEALLRLNASLPAGATEEEARNWVTLTDAPLAVTTGRQAFYLLAANGRFRTAGAQWVDCGVPAEPRGYADLQAFLQRANIGAIQHSDLGNGLFNSRGVVRYSPPTRAVTDVLNWEITYAIDPLTTLKWEMNWTIEGERCAHLRVWGA